MCFSFPIFTVQSLGISLYNRSFKIFLWNLPLMMVVKSIVLVFFYRVAILSDFTGT